MTVMEQTGDLDDVNKGEAIDVMVTNELNGMSSDRKCVQKVSSNT